MNRRTFLGWFAALAAAPVVKALAPTTRQLISTRALDEDYLRRVYLDPAIAHLAEQHERELYDTYLKAGDILTIRVPSIDPVTRRATGSVLREFTITATTNMT